MRRSIHIVSALGLTSALGSAFLLAEDRVPAPAAAELAAAEANIRDIYKADLAKTRTPDKAILAKTLLKEAGTVQELPSKFQLLVDARTLAAQGGDGATSMAAADMLCRLFQVKPGEMHVVVVEPILASKFTQASALETSDAFQHAAEQAVGSDEYDAALTLAHAAETTGRLTGSGAPVASAQQTIRWITAIRPEAEKIKASLAVIDKNPNDGPANTAVGRFYCLLKNDWEHGVWYLSNCSDPVLKDAAARDIASANGAPVDLVGAADAWYNIAAAVDPTAKPFVQIHVYTLYANALHGLDGLDKTKAEKRINELQKVVDAHTDFLRMWTTIHKALATHDVKKWDFIGGAFSHDEFDEVPPNGALLIGFNYTSKDHGRYPGVVQAIYATPSGEILGRRFGKPEKGALLMTTKARNGYAVGALYVRGGGGFDAFQPIFMRVTPDGLNPNIKIEGPYVGGDGGGDGTVGDGNFIIGLHLKINDKDGAVMSLSIITTTTSPGTSITQTRMKTTKRTLHVSN